MLPLQTKLLTIACVVALCGTASADTFLESTNRKAFFGNDSIDWGQFAACQDISSPAAATSAGGLGLSASVADGNGMAEAIQANADLTGGCPAPNQGWYGNFSPGNNLLIAADAITLTFNNPVNGVGAQIEAVLAGSFVATLDVYDGTTLLKSIQSDGDSTGTADGSAIFMGLRDVDGAKITSVVFSVLLDDPTLASFRGFGINTVDLADTVPVPDPSQSPVPEPGSLLSVTAVLCLWAAAFVLRQVKRKTTEEVAADQQLSLNQSSSGAPKMAADSVI